MERNSFNIEDVLVEISKHKTFLFKDSKNKTNGILLRHDIDESIIFAEKIFKHEMKFGVKSTFFVMVTNPLYNIFSLNNRKILKSMIKEGYEIGLHFDTSIYNYNDLYENFKYEIDILEDLIDSKVSSYSLHQPSVSTGLKILKIQIILTPTTVTFLTIVCIYQIHVSHLRGKIYLNIFQKRILN